MLTEMSKQLLEQLGVQRTEAAIARMLPALEHKRRVGALGQLPWTPEVCACVQTIMQWRTQRGAL